MRVERTQRFDDEVQCFALCFCCEECAHFDATRQSCRHEWPAELHRRERYLRDAATSDLVFCKEFELC